MYEEPPAKRPRKGTRSCVACRQRKVRCIWPSPASETCQDCAARGKVCEQQVHMIPSSDATRVTSRSRIGRLEDEVSHLWASLRKLEAKAGCVPTELGKRAQSQVVDDASDTDSIEASPADFPNHLRSLFDNDMLDSNEPEILAQSPRGTHSHMTKGIATMRRLLPSREDMVTIASYTVSWLSLYTTLFPMAIAPDTSKGILSAYDAAQDQDSSSTSVAVVLLLVAITVQQAPEETAGRGVKSIKDAPRYIREVCQTVERFIINDDNTAGTLEGIQVTLFFIRLHLGRAKLRRMWLLLRRATALAELAGLPRAAATFHSQNISNTDTFSGQNPSTNTTLLGQKAEIWDSICLVDRMVSIMWSLPLATSSYSLPQRPLVNAQGIFAPQTYLYNLTEIACRLLDLDALHASGKQPSELFNTVTSIDQSLRSLAASAPQNWWQIECGKHLSIDQILQFWHQYVVIRTQLHLALAHDENESQQFAFNFILCLNACKELAKRYVSLRRILPSGFFAAPVIDMEVLTAVVFLLLAGFRNARSGNRFPSMADKGLTAQLVEDVLLTMDAAASRSGGGSARKPASAIRALMELLKLPVGGVEKELALNLPFVGRIRVAMKARPAARTRVGNDDETTMTTPAGGTSGDVNLLDSLSFSMEFPDDFSFLTEEYFEPDRWLMLD